MEHAEIQAILKENARRAARDADAARFDPVAGTGCSGERVPHGPAPYTAGREMVPREMLDDPGLPAARTPQAWARLRCRHDFEYWCFRAARVKDKESPRLVPLLLNRGQRRVVAALEEARRAGVPMRLIVLKARQWGASTVIAMYIAWLQCVRATNWHSLLCAHCSKTAADIRGMLSTLLLNYPEELWEGEGRPADLVPYQGQRDIREIPGRGCHITLGTSESVNSVRGSDYAMAHLSEVGFWKDTPQASPGDFVRSICGAINRSPLTLIAMESTANGVGTFFHTEWTRAAAGKSDKTPVFVPWYEIDLYSEPVRDPAALWEGMDAYERWLWHTLGLTLERINWYHHKRLEYPCHHQMQAEFPTTPTEAFTNTGANVFAVEGVERLREGCRAPLAVGEVTSGTGAVTGPAALRARRFSPDSRGCLEVWEWPDAANCEYVAAVDVGGRTARADWSVVCVLATRRGDPLALPRVAAQWRGHIDHDLLTWKAAQIAAYYGGAMLVFESNSLESGAGGGDCGSGHGAYILNELYGHYPNMYYRMDPSGQSRLPGFHTNRATKQMVVNELIAAVRDGLYEERDTRACDELSVYEQLPNGSYAATPGNHDDILMTRAIGLHVCRTLRPEGCDSMEADPDLGAFLRRGCRG